VDDEKFYRRCLKCGAIESVYKKRVINGSTYLLPNKFYFCPNPDCFLHIDVPTDLQKFSLVENEYFKWIKIFEYKSFKI
jgi:hypothetical protein